MAVSVKGGKSSELAIVQKPDGVQSDPWSMHVLSNMDTRLRSGGPIALSDPTKGQGIRVGN